MTKMPDIDLNFSRPLDVHRWSDYSEANTFVDQIYSSLPFDNGNKQIRKQHLKVLLLDLYVAWATDPDLKLAISRDNNKYKAKSRYNELHISKVIRDVVDLLDNAGLVHTANGFLDHVTKVGRVTRVWATDKLAAEFKKAIGLRFAFNQHEDRETVILRDAEKNDIPYEDNRQTIAMRAHLRAYNALLAKTHIDLDYLDKPVLSLGKNGREYNLPITQQDKFVKRIFNNQRWDQGGRFYGGWWQRCPQEQRSHICFDGIVTQEVDYSGLHIVLLYAQQGIDYWAKVGDDPYEINWPEGIDENIDQRAATKLLLLTAINAGHEKEAFQGFRAQAATNSPEKKLTNKVLGEVLNKLKEKHKPIANMIASGAGIDLMYIDSQITEHLITYFTKQGIPMLSIHDSYVVPFGYDNDLIREMTRVFQTVTGVKEVRLKHTTINSDEYFWADQWDDEKQKAQAADLGAPSERHKQDLALFTKFHNLPPEGPEWTPTGTAVY